MQEYNSYDLFVKNPRIHTNFPFLALDCNNKKTIPPRMRFQEMHWHEEGRRQPYRQQLSEQTADKGADSAEELAS